tara:strand:+ start:309 stop:1163 length:855 start_codon:yes stop_codon:yes gene_type:complete
MKTTLLLIFSAFGFGLIAQNSPIISLSEAKKLYSEEKYELLEEKLAPYSGTKDFSLAYEMLLADARHKEEKYEKAVEGYSIVLKNEKDNYLAYFNRGAARVFLEEYKDALKDLETAISFRPDSAEMYYYKGYCEASLFDYKDAIVSYSKAIDLKPDYAAAYYNRGAAKGELNQYEAGMSDFSVALEKNPDLEGGLMNIGLSKLGMGNLEGAIADFDQVIAKRDENLAKAYFYRGEAKYDNGQKEEACEDFNRAMNLNYEPADENIGSLCGTEKKTKRREIDITF